MHRQTNTRAAQGPRLMPLFLTLLILMPLRTMAQDDFGVWYAAGIEKKLSKKLSIEAEGEFRTRNDSRTADRWDIGVGAEYKIAKGLKIGVGYDLLYDNNPEKITTHADGSYNNWRPSYWGFRHRAHADITGSIDVGRVRLSLRERWQYTYRPTATTTRYDFDNSYWEDTSVGAKGSHVLRSRLQAAWDIPHCKADPYANVELFNSWSLTKTRYTVGADWKLTKRHAVGVYYRYQDVRDNSENQPDEHIAGVTYKFKF